MKVIDLVVKIANGEIPEHIRYNDLFMTYDKKRQNYYDSFGAEIDWKYTIMQYLNDELEIIEAEPKEETNVSEEQILFNNLNSMDREYIIKIMKLLQPPEEVESEDIEFDMLKALNTDLEDDVEMG